MTRGFRLESLTPIAQQNRWEESLLDVVAAYDRGASETGCFSDYGVSLRGLG